MNNLKRLNYKCSKILRKRTNRILCRRYLRDMRKSKNPQSAYIATRYEILDSIHFNISELLVEHSKQHFTDEILIERIKEVIFSHV